MRIYISGGITNVEPTEAARLFTEAETVIAKAGHTPLNPLTLVDQTPGRHYNEYLADALNIMLKQAEAVLFLHRWNFRKGAFIEHEIAEVLEMPKYFAFDELPIGSDWPEQADEAAA